MSTKLEINERLVKPPTNDGQEKRPLFIEQFRQSRFRFALQKDGELTDISLKIVNLAYGKTDSPATQSPNKGQLISTADQGNVGLILARNKSICNLVATGAADAGIIGLDQLYESGYKDQLIVAKELKEVGQWDIVLATPKDSTISRINELKIVATQYPIIAQAFFNLVNHWPKIILSHGSTEIMPYLEQDGQSIDGIIDLRATGRTLSNHFLQAWEPPITTIYPVLIVNPNTAINDKKRQFLQRLVAINQQDLN